MAHKATLMTLTIAKHLSACGDFWEGRLILYFLLPVNSE